MSVWDFTNGVHPKCITHQSTYLQIYNEMIRDLLNPSSGYLELREDAKGEIRIAGITEFSTCNAKEVHTHSS